jgi:hypothetical protein
MARIRSRFVIAMLRPAWPGGLPGCKRPAADDACTQDGKLVRPGPTGGLIGRLVTVNDGRRRVCSAKGGRVACG